MLERRDQRERRLGALVAVDAVDVEAVVPSAAFEVADRDPDIVGAEEPADAGSIPSCQIRSPVTARPRTHASAIVAASIGC